MTIIPLGHGGALVEAIFVARPNRFLIEARLDDQIVLAHMADRGRLRETLIPGARMLLAHRDGAKRATQFQAVAVYVGERLASIDTALPNRLVESALRAAELPPFVQYPHIRREATVGKSRFDFLLRNEADQCLLEVKSAGLIIDGVALFPDAPTERGRRHVLELAELAHTGIRTSIVFIAQGQADAIAMYTAIDPAFAEALSFAQRAGVEVYGYSCPITIDGISIGPEIPIQLSRT